MSKLGWFVVGAAVGIVAISQYRDNPKVAEALDESSKLIEEFRHSVVEGFKEREAELKSENSKP